MFQVGDMVRVKNGYFPSALVGQEVEVTDPCAKMYDWHRNGEVRVRTTTNRIDGGYRTDFWTFHESDLELARKLERAPEED